MNPMEEVVAEEVPAEASEAEASEEVVLVGKTSLSTYITNRQQKFILMEVKLNEKR